MYGALQLSIDQDKATGNVSLTLQPSVVLDGKGGEGGGLSWGSESLKAGLKVKGKVAAVKEFGVFIQVHDSEVRGGEWRSIPAQCSDKSIVLCKRSIHVPLSFLLLCKCFTFKSFA